MRCVDVDHSIGVYSLEHYDQAVNTNTCPGGVHQRCRAAQCEAAFGTDDVCVTGYESVTGQTSQDSKYICYGDSSSNNCKQVNWF